MYFYLISDRFKILKRSKKSTSHVTDRSLAANPPAAALVHAFHATNLSQSPEHLLKQSEKLQTTESEGEGRFDCELASVPGPAQLSSMSGRAWEQC